jgi:glycosyltransferase involved in cell wall biosynthesis
MATIPSRLDKAAEMIKEIDYQIKGKPVELIYLGDAKHMSVGSKRNKLLAMASGKYISYVDDDDSLLNTYTGSILKAAENDSDCIVFDVMYCEAGESKRVVYDINFEADRNFPDRYERLPNHLMAIRRTIAAAVGFPDVSCGEDFGFAKGIKPLIKTQTRIPSTLYFYMYSAMGSETPRS